MTQLATNRPNVRCLEDRFALLIEAIRAAGADRAFAREDAERLADLAVSLRVSTAHLVLLGRYVEQETSVADPERGGSRLSRALAGAMVDADGGKSRSSEHGRGRRPDSRRFHARHATVAT